MKKYCQLCKQFSVSQEPKSQFFGNKVQILIFYALKVKKKNKQKIAIHYNSCPLSYLKMLLAFSRSSEVWLSHTVSENEVTRYIIFSIKQKFSWNRNELKCNMETKYKGDKYN